jgi:hypothetical protein
VEIVKQMNVPAEFFYKKIIDSVMYDVQEATGQTLKEKQLIGFEYIKKFNEKTSAKIKIEELITDQLYIYRTSTTRNDFTATYQIRSIDEKSCEIQYVEKMDSHRMIQSLNDMVTGVLLSFFKKRQFKQMLAMIEQSY